MPGLDIFLDTLLRKPGGGAADSSTVGAIPTQPIGVPDSQGSQDPSLTDEDIISKMQQEIDSGSGGSEEESPKFDDAYELFIPLPLGPVAPIAQLTEMFIPDNMQADPSGRTGILINYRLSKIDPSILFPIFETMGINPDDYEKALLIHEPITDVRLDHFPIPIPTGFKVLLLGVDITEAFTTPIPGTGVVTFDGEDIRLHEVIAALLLYTLLIAKLPQAIEILLKSGLVAAGVRLGTSVSNNQYRKAVLGGIAVNTGLNHEILSDLAELATNLFESGVTDELSDKDSELIRKLKLWTRTL